MDDPSAENSRITIKGDLYMEILDAQKEKLIRLLICSWMNLCQIKHT